MPKKPANLEKEIGTPFAGPGGKPWLVRSKVWEQHPFTLITLAAFTTTIFFRRNFGERYLSPFKMFAALIPLAIYAICMRMFARGFIFWSNLSEPVPISSWITWFAFSVLFFLVASLHLFAAVRRRKKFEDEFSYSDGRPWEWILALMPFVRNEWDFEIYYEPIIIAITGCVLIYFHDYFGPYLILAAIGSYFIAVNKFHIRRTEELDRVDGMTLAKHGQEPESDTPQNITHIKPFGGPDRTDPPWRSN